MIAFQVPGEPVAFARTRGANRYTPPEQKSFMAAIGLKAKRAMCGAEPLVGPVRLEARFTFPRPKSHKGAKLQSPWKTSVPDADNLTKLLKDACNKIVWWDDAQVADLAVQKVYGPLPGIVVVVTSLEEGATA